MRSLQMVLLSTPFKFLAVTVFLPFGGGALTELIISPGGSRETSPVQYMLVRQISIDSKLQVFVG